VVAAAIALGVMRLVRWTDNGVKPSGPLEQDDPETTPGRHLSQKVKYSLWNRTPDGVG